MPHHSPLVGSREFKGSGEQDPNEIKGSGNRVLVSLNGVLEAGFR